MTVTRLSCGREDQKGQNEEPVHRVHAHRPPLGGRRSACEVPASKGENEKTDDEGRRRREKDCPIIIHGHETFEGEHAHQVQLHHACPLDHRLKGFRKSHHRQTPGERVEDLVDSDDDLKLCEHALACFFCYC